MNLALLLPGALFALFALALPLLIHLSRRSEQRPTDFAALRWISAQLRPRRKLVFQEIPLLLLRLLLLIALALFLAKPVSLQPAASEHWLVIAPGVDLDRASDLPSASAAERHWLAPGFPEIDSKPVTTDVAVSSLLRELDAALPASTQLTIVVPQELSGLDGERLRLSRRVGWKIVSGKMPSTKTVEKISPIRLAIRHDAAHADEAIYFKAAHAVWQSELKNDSKDLLDIADIASTMKHDRTAILWLAAGELPNDIRNRAVGGASIIVSKDSVIPEMKSGVPAWRDEKGKVLVRVAPAGQGRILQWQQTLQPQAMPELLEPAFPEHLKMLLQASSAAPSRALAASQTPLTGAKILDQAPHSLQTWLALLLASLFLLERWLANAPRRWSTA